MKKSLLIAAIALACAVATPRVSAQSAMFTYTGVPAGPVMPGSSFTIGMNIVVTTGGNVNSIVGSSYWFSPGESLWWAIPICDHKPRRHRKPVHDDPSGFSDASERYHDGGFSSGVTGAGTTIGHIFHRQPDVLCRTQQCPGKLYSREHNQHHTGSRGQDIGLP